MAINRIVKRGTTCRIRNAFIWANFALRGRRIGYEGIGGVAEAETGNEKVELPRANSDLATRACLVLYCFIPLWIFVIAWMLR